MHSSFSNATQLTTLLELQRVLSKTSLSKTTTYRLIKAGKFPAPVKISTGRVAWRSDEIVAWLVSRSYK